jgi:hypothetical protein
MVVVGLIALLISLLMPAITKARAAAQASVCLSNLRQMGNGWQMYVAENKGRLPEYMWQMPATPDVVWRGYWIGILDSYKVRGDVLMCPTASDVIPFNQNRGFGNVVYAWTGQYSTLGTVVKLNPTTFRQGSYGYNHYLTVGGGGWGPNGKGAKINAVRPACEVPVFLDSVYVDFQPNNGAEAMPAPPPPNLTGSDFPPTAPEHWRFLIARHGRAINGYMADGSARRIPLEDTYRLSWTNNWQKYRLPLPAF